MYAADNAGSERRGEPTDAIRFPEMVGAFDRYSRGFMTVLAVSPVVGLSALPWRITHSPREVLIAGRSGGLSAGRSRPCAGTEGRNCPLIYGIAMLANASQPAIERPERTLTTLETIMERIDEVDASVIGEGGPRCCAAGCAYERRASHVGPGAQSRGRRWPGDAS
jgi:hypothetical protein